jgi:hypothetical protein
MPLLFLADCVLFFCQGGTGLGAAPYRIVIIPKMTGIQYYDAVKREIENADMELPGVGVTWAGSPVDDISLQVALPIEMYTAENVDAYDF